MLKSVSDSLKNTSMEKIEIWLEGQEMRFNLKGNPETLIGMLEACKEWLIEAERRREKSALKWGEIGEA